MDIKKKRVIICIIIAVLIAVTIFAFFIVRNRSGIDDTLIPDPGFVRGSEDFGKSSISEVKTEGLISLVIGGTKITLTAYGGLSENEVLDNIRILNGGNPDLSEVSFSDDDFGFTEIDFGGSVFKKVYDLNLPFDFREVVINGYDMRDSETLQNIIFARSKKIGTIYFNRNFPDAHEMTISDGNISVALRDILAHIPRQILGKTYFRIEGNTESTNSYDASLYLSIRRANYIRNMMTGAFGIAPKYIQAEGKGYGNLAFTPDDASHPDNQVHNRRVDIYITVFETEPDTALMLPGIYKIRSGDTLKKIAGLYFGDESRAMDIFIANPQLRSNTLKDNPAYEAFAGKPWDLIFPGEELRIPEVR